MIIVEGADLVGKTTFAKRLEIAIPGMVYQHLHKLTPHFERLEGHKQLVCNRAVRDRFHISDVVYKKASKTAHCFHWKDVNLLNAYLRTVPVYTVIVTCENCMLEERYDKLSEEERASEPDLKTAILANECYRTIATTGKLGEYSFDVDYWIDCSRKGRPYPNDTDVYNASTIYNRLRSWR